MKYVNKLTDGQIKELIGENEIYKENCGSLFIFVRTSKHSSIGYVLEDFNINIKGFHCLKNIKDEFNKEYRKKMLEYFGEQYAIDYLLRE